MGKNEMFFMQLVECSFLFCPGIIRDSGSKIVYNDMPLYFPCPCRTNQMMVAQLMRVHIVTPKAPVNVILDPKVSGFMTYKTPYFIEIFNWFSYILS